MSSPQHTGHNELTTAEPDRFENPGLAPHRPRLGDEDPKAAKRSERQVVALFTVSILATIGGIVGYVAFPVADPDAGNLRMNTLVLGVGLGLGMLGIGVAAVHWAKTLMNDHEKVEERHAQRGDDATRERAVEMLREGADDSGIARRPVLKGAFGTALALAPLTFLVPLVGNLGADWNVSKFRHTAWAGAPDGGRRYLATDPTDRRLKASDITRGSMVHVMPWRLPEEEHYLEEKAKAVAIVMRVDPSILKEPEERQGWSYDGIVAYSKVCTHVGCPVALYEQQTHHVLCPCHQSTFDVTDQAKVVFGPAKRPLPQLPIAVDDEGYLYAQDDFNEPVGPSYWERER
ncbi:ubiquinol-cytochrome c reductase iron-sulfur subunit [Ruania alba]|uniref:Cytochrome bc1 complex Rieske iron-sulfur subunit n=1 Tax=Ruania alba TaxID=648782 RepID=A0A1H5FG21_9MICO|nr:Rieske 2Fe-2S domain-containing protein [Ruania alba]SEE02351.1 menaquinol-cytochrome c reductase iron-sulfur subunit precursor [Ruania alba]